MLPPGRLNPCVVLCQPERKQLTTRLYTTPTTSQQSVPNQHNQYPPGHNTFFGWLTACASLNHNFNSEHRR